MIRILLSAVGYAVGLPILLLLLDLLPWGTPIVPDGFQAWPVVFATLGSLGAALALARIFIGNEGPAVWRRLLEDAGTFLTLATMFAFAAIARAPVRWALTVAAGSLLWGLTLAVLRSLGERVRRR